MQGSGATLRKSLPRFFAPAQFGSGRKTACPLSHTSSAAVSPNWVNARSDRRRRRGSAVRDPPSPRATRPPPLSSAEKKQVARGIDAPPRTLDFLRDETAHYGDLPKGRPRRAGTPPARREPRRLSTFFGPPPPDSEEPPDAEGSPIARMHNAPKASARHPTLKSPRLLAKKSRPPPQFSNLRGPNLRKLIRQGSPRRRNR